MTEPSTIAALWRLLRPHGLGFVLLLPWFGYGFAHWAWASDLRAPGAFVSVLAAWASLHAGTMWLNAALDRDAGEVLWGAPVAVPATTARWAAGALALAPTVAWNAGPTAFVCAASCALLSFLYSSPHTAWKGHPVGGPLVNVLGYGVLSPLAGFAITGLPAGRRTVAVFACMACVTGALYCAAQAFQQQEDGARGYRTLVVTHGPEVTLRAAQALFALGFGGLFALVAIGWLPRPCAIAVPVAAYVVHGFGAWARDVARGQAATEARGRGLSGAALLTALLLVIGAYLAYLQQSLAGGPRFAGMATAAGFPG